MRPDKGQENKIGILQIGALLRIADACETMAKDRDKLQEELAVVRESYHTQGLQVEVLRKRISSQKGQITRLKNQLNTKA
jgi:uncharacterized protein involved in exopolysaccharide biosynthesis